MLHAVDQYQLRVDSPIKITYRGNDAVLTANSNIEVLQYPIAPTDSSIIDNTANVVLLSLAKDSYITTDRDGSLVNLYVQHPSDHNASPKIHILLDAGHGGHDPGAMSTHGFLEKDITLKFTQLLAEKLEHHRSVMVSKTRNTDQTIDKYERLEKILQLQPDYMLSIHADAFTSPKPSGLGIFLLDQKSMPAKRTKQILKKYQAEQVHSQKDALILASNILHDLSGHIHLHAPEPKHASLVILRAQHIPSMLIELGFLSHPDEAIRLQDAAYLDALSTKISQTILRQISVI